jgi:hypothetical protein
VESIKDVALIRFYVGTIIHVYTCGFDSHLRCRSFSWKKVISGLCCVTLSFLVSKFVMYTSCRLVLSSSRV